jgi:hypothetical protein
MFALTKRSFARELKRSLRGCRPRLSLGLDLFKDGYCLDFFGFLIPLVFLDRFAREPREIMESWGIRHSDRSFHCNWGSHCKIIHLPWDYEHVKCEVQRPDGSWVPYVACYETDREPDGRWQAAYPYHYMLDSGEVQHRLATIYVERREWRWRGAMWSPWPSRRSQCISVEFNGEVGERTGSWKGGTVGCGYEMKKGETPQETLRRMQRERRFT